MAVSWLAASSLAVCLNLCQPARAALDPTKDKILYIVGDAHLDDQWNWTVQPTINTFIPATLHTNFAFFAAYPHYTFSWEEGWRYQLVKEYYPADYLVLSNYIAQGRWRMTGNAMAAGDVNIVSPESLIRHALLANEFWTQEFHTNCVDLFLPDCFGFGYALPSVAAHCGLKGFSSCRVSAGSAYPPPFRNIGRWIGPDGASIVAVLQPGWYSSSIGSNLANDPNELARVTNNFAQTGLYLDYRYFGTGDQGGGPTPASASYVEQSVTTTTGLVNVLNFGADQMFRDLTPSQVGLLPTYQGEMLAQLLGTGSYTARPELKQYNRRNELGADAAERILVIADWLQGGGTYPQERLNKAWTAFLWNQHHDILTGDAINDAYPFTWNDEILSLNQFGAEERQGAGVLATALDTRATGVPLVVYNPLSIPREDVVEALVTFAGGAPAAVRVYETLTGNEVPSQMGTPSGNQVPVTFLAAVPAVGAKVFDVRPTVSGSGLSTGLSVSTSQLQNDQYTVQLDPNSGDVTSIYDRINHQQLLSAPIRWAFLYDLSTDLPAWEIQYNNVVAAPLSYLGGPPAFQILEHGPARVSLAVTRFNAGSAFTERIRLGAGDAGDRVEWDVSVNWATPQTLVKMTFPLSVQNPLATFDLGLGVIQRPNETPNLYEVPAQQWADLTSTNGAYGVTIMNDCKYGWDKPNNNTLRQTIFHDPAVGSSFVNGASNGFGTHRFTMAIMGHTNDWRSGGSPWVAARLNQPLQAFQTTSHPGVLGPVFGFLTCTNSNVMIKALKKCEYSNEIVVRLQELTGQPQTVQLSCAAPITAARFVTGEENPLTNGVPVLTLTNGTITVSLGGYAPLALALTLAPPTNLVAKAQSAPVSLPFNLDAFSTDGNRTDGNFDRGYTYPAELVPATIVRGGITFQMGPTNDYALNALSCTGQVLTINGSGYDHLYLLAAAASNDGTGTFTVDSQTTDLTVRCFTGFFGQWNWPPHLNRDEVGWICTHRHNSGGGNDAYTFCYMFKYCINLPPNAGTLTLPNAPNLRVFAMTLARNTTADTVAVGGVLGQNQLPWANAGPSRILNAGPGGTATVILDGSGSVDPDGTIISYLWTLNGAVLATNPQAVVTLPLGTNIVTLTVTDDQGGSSEAAATLTVLTPLTVNLTASPVSAPSPPLTVQFTGQASGGTAPAQDTTDDHLGTITAQGQNPPNEVATNAFDDNLSSKWLDFANAYPTTRSSWIQYQYANGAQHVVTNYSITSGNDATVYPERNPANWRLLGSNDGATWTTLDTQTNQTFTASMQTRLFSVANPGTYNIYKLVIDSVANPATAVAMQLDEIQLLGLPAYNYLWSFGDGTTSSAQNPQHTYTNNGNYLVILSVSYGLYTGTNTALITVGPPLQATVSASPTNGTIPLMVQFTAQASGGNAARAPYDTTDDHRGTVTAQGENNGLNGFWEVATNAFDDNVATKWLDFATAYPTTRSSWIQYQYAGGLRCYVSQYAITSANDAPERDPMNWRLLGSNDGGVSRTTLDIRTGVIFTNRFLTLWFPVVSPGAYNLYRLQIDSVANMVNGTPTQAVAVQLAELQFVGVPVYSYSWTFGDGATSSLQNPQHTYANYGSYLVSLVVSDGAASVTNRVTITVSPLLLGAARSGANTLSLNWPAWATSGHLYSTTNLAPPVVWTLVTNPVTGGSGTNTVTVQLDATGARFFQLRP